ncbi:hypothetical protein M405DRAFT_835756 [Rhizopogon salebrosus TDB-379]|nr:hypothetical protein M405DRAFT_835756 [Rhizopogon salebrosus TDB-379]
MGSEQEVEPSSILVNTNLRSPHSSAPQTMEDYFATAWCSMVQESGAGLGRGRVLSVSRSEKEEVQC